MTLYGIKNCDTVRKARKFLKAHDIDYTFVDFRETPVDAVKIRKWLEQVPIDTLLNRRGTTWRKLKLAEKNLSDEEKIAWMVKENTLIKRPVVEYEDNVYVGFDETTYEKAFTKERG